jgi:hypothetical protein
MLQVNPADNQPPETVLVQLNCNGRTFAAGYSINEFDTPEKRKEIMKWFAAAVEETIKIAKL